MLCNQHKMYIFAANLKNKSGMDKDFITKILTPGSSLRSSDLSAEEKKRLYALMREHGATDGFTYNRFFKEGFSQWEIDGIFDLKDAFLTFLHDEEKIFLEVRCAGKSEPRDGEEPVPLWRHFYRVPPKAEDPQDYREFSFDLNRRGDYWRFLGDIAYRRRFGDFMAWNGMRAYNTVMKRFAVDDWKDYENQGIRRIMEQFMSENQ